MNTDRTPETLDEALAIINQLRIEIAKRPDIAIVDTREPAIVTSARDFSRLLAGRSYNITLGMGRARYEFLGVICTLTPNSSVNAEAFFQNDGKAFVAATGPVEVRSYAPTEEGRRRYPPDGRYIANVEPGESGTPCTCKPECPDPCKGECGCKACHEGYGDALDCDYD